MLFRSPRSRPRRGCPAGRRPPGCRSRARRRHGARRSPAPALFQNWIKKSWLLTRLYWDLSLRFLNNRMSPDAEWLPWKDRLLKTLLVEMNRESPAFLVSGFLNGEKEPRQSFDIFMTAAKSAGLPFLDISPFFNEAKNVHFRNDIHWNSRGHEIAAEAFFKILEPEIRKGLRVAR